MRPWASSLRALRFAAVPGLAILQGPIPAVPTRLLPVAPMRLSFAPVLSLALLGAAAPPRSPTARLNALVAAEFSGARARDVVGFMDRWFRLPGNPGFDASIDRVAAILDSAGYVRADRAAKGDRLVYRIEEYPLDTPAWEPVDASLTIAGDTQPLLAFATNRNMLAINSWPTKPGGIDAEVVFAPTGSPAELAGLDVRGKLVYAETRPAQVYAAVQRAGALGVLTYALPDYTKPAEHPTSIQFGGVPYDAVNRGFGILLSTAARDALLALRAHGPVKVHVAVDARFRVANERTLVAELRGKSRPEERFVFSAHVQEPGANDNASGVATQAEMARVAAVLLKRHAIDPSRTITFLWGDEIRATRRFLEQDTLRLRGVKWGTSLDMVGEDTEKTGGTFLIEKMPDPSAIWTRGNDHHTEWGGRPLSKAEMMPHWFNDWMLGRCLEQAAKSRWVVRTNPFEGGSDHTPFLQARKPGLLLWHFTDVYYHTDGDRPVNVSATTMANVGTAALTAALGLVQADRQTALAIVEETSAAALARIDAEERLSAAAVAAGKDPAAEREILATWSDWYVGALERIAEVEPGGPSQDVLHAIVDARSRVASFAAAAEGRLR